MKHDFGDNCIAQKVCATLEQLQEFCKEIIALLKPDEKVMLLGAMGSGKTTLVRNLLQLMDYDEVVSSPTFNLVNEYQISPSGNLFSQRSLTVFHIDLYRLEGGEENIGLGEIFDSQAMVFVEWGERVEWITERASLLIDINFSAGGSQSREVKVFTRQR